MCTGWCPLAAEWGNWAEWASAVAAVIFGYFVWRSSVRTHDLAEKTNDLARVGNETNAALARLEEKREADAAQLRAQEGILILVSLARAIGQSYVALSTIDELLRNPKHVERLASNGEAAAYTIKVLESGQFAIPESTRSRMHFLSMEIAAKVLRIEGAIPLFRDGLNTLSGSTPDSAKKTVEIFMAGLKIATREALEVYNLCQGANRSAGLEVSDLPTQD